MLTLHLRGEAVRALYKGGENAEVLLVVPKCIDGTPRLRHPAMRIDADGVEGVHVADVSDEQMKVLASFKVREVVELLDELEAEKILSPVSIWAHVWKAAVKKEEV